MKDEAVVERCKDGHVETTVVDTRPGRRVKETHITTDDSPDTGDVPDEESLPEDATRGTIDDNIERSERQGRGRPSADEVGSSAPEYATSNNPAIRGGDGR